MQFIYDMKLHDTIDIGTTRIRRVAGGWIYTCFDNKNITSVFVPYHEEFKKIEEN